MDTPHKRNPGKEVEGRKSSAEQVGTNAEELAAVVQGGRRREIQVGGRQDAGAKSTTSTSDGRRLGDVENSYTISIGSNVVRIGHIAGGLQRHF